jgi:integrase
VWPDLSKIITRYFDKLGLEGTPTNHMMRKTFAMRMYELLGKNEDALIKVSVHAFPPGHLPNKGVPKYEFK